MSKYLMRIKLGWVPDNGDKSVKGVALIKLKWTP